MSYEQNLRTIRSELEWQFIGLTLDEKLSFLTDVFCITEELRYEIAGPCTELSDQESKSTEVEGNEDEKDTSNIQDTDSSLLLHREAN